MIIIIKFILFFILGAFFMIWKSSNYIELGVSVGSIILANKYWISGAIAVFAILLLIYSLLINGLKKES
jgi:hypothetical protein